MWRVLIVLLVCLPWILEAATLVNINTADSTELETLPGIGATYALRIIAYREDEGVFETIDEIQNVKGIGPATFEKIQDFITVSEETVIEEEEEAEVVSDFVIEARDTVFVNELVSFEAVWDDDEERLVRYEWNFGDTGKDTGTRPEYRFSYPGTFVVVAVGRYRGDVYEARHEVTVLPPMFSLTETSGAIQIHNDAPAEVRMGGYMLSATNTVIIPYDTVLLPYATLTIARDRIGVGVPRLYDVLGTLVATRTVEEEVVLEAFPTETQTATVVESVPEGGGNMAYIGLAAVLGIGILGVYTRRKDPLDIEDLERSV